jgi:16S rRNA (cytidine1402-2'-O)-methyltransferase
VIKAGRLYVVSTPIGNLGDLSGRAREVLGRVALVAAEDTRHSGSLLQGMGIACPMVSLHEHNERERVPELLDRLRRGEDIALVSDAGTPLVSDPGFHLVRGAIEAGLGISPVPGPCAAIAALSVSGLPTDRFCFEGFLPPKQAARRSRLAGLAAETRTLVFYEAPQRLAASLADAAATLGTVRRATVARELTKLHESLYHGTLQELAERAAVDADMSRGEIVLAVEGAPAAQDGASQEIDKVLKALLKSHSPSQAAALAAEITGARRNECYARALALSGE